MQSITPFLWFDNDAEAAARFYVSVFKNSKMGSVVPYPPTAAEATGKKVGSAMTVEFELAGQKIMAINAGTEFQFTQALSFFVWCETEEELDALWQQLSQGGTERMPLAAYHWSPKYGWIADRYGVEWQLTLAKEKQKIAPSLLFVNQKFGKGGEAIEFYQSLFPNSKIEFMARDETTQSILYSIFTLNGQRFVLMEGQGKHDFDFNPAVSFFVLCETQKEIDELWKKLSAVPEAEQCGWLVDRYGVSWQIVSAFLIEKMKSGSSKKQEEMMKAMMQMKKMDIQKLIDAYEK
jgi:predicted 3-demethylubiquinone-9 3-methyltransferase (glyoxalase superfamily)